MVSMKDAAALTRLAKAAKNYSKDISQLVGSESTTEATFYPSIRALLSAALEAEDLPFDVRINTSEEKSGGGVNLPDVALYDSGGKFLVVCGEVKLPSREIREIALSTDGKDQIGRYLAATRAVLLCNVRGFALLTVKADWNGSGPVPPEARRIEHTVELWPSVGALKGTKAIAPESLEEFVELVETAVTRYAPIAEPESLARILARQARNAKADLPEKFTNAVQGLLDDFGKALGVTFVGQEGEEFFRSSLIQTAFYGLFAGWALWWQGARAKAFRWEDLSDYLKIPFLGSLFYEFRHPSRIKELRLAGHLDVAIETLSRVNGDMFFKRFTLPTLDRDEETATTAIMHFYEPFLEAFDPDLRKDLGVWYTPSQIVRYQVGKIDRLLRDELGCSRGFADENVVVLDPACGTGAYLLEVLRYAAAQLKQEGAGATLAAKLLDAVCRRFIGFEILTAPFVISQLQLYLLLARLGAAPDEKHRPAVFLTNALTGWQGPDQLKLNFPELQEEHDLARDVKRDAKIIVVLGNPPYNRFAGVPLEEEADLVDYYKGITRNGDGKQIGQSLLYTRWRIRKHLLDDLYIRFFRLADVRIGEKAKFGVVSFISNSSYIAGRSHPIMRKSLLSHFDQVWIDNLHGNRIASERTPWGQSCETIFNTEGIGPGIKVGTCVSTFLKRDPSSGKPAKVFIRDFWGRAAKKRDALVSSLTMDAWTTKDLKAAADKPEGPRGYQEFYPSEERNWKFASVGEGGFENWPALDDLFPRSLQGVNPNRGLDGSVIDTERSALENRMRDYFSNLNFEELERRYPNLCEAHAGYEPESVRTSLLQMSIFDPEKILPYVLFPLDGRWVYYEREAKLLNRPRPELGEHLQDNEFLVGLPQARRPSESRPFALSGLFDLHLHDWGSVGFPAELNPHEEEGSLFKGPKEKLIRSANLAEEAWSTFQTAWNLKGDLQGTDAKRFCRELFRYAMAICHSPQYEVDHKDSLAQDWPHIPISKDKKRFEEGVKLGDQIARLLDPFGDPSRVLQELLGKDGNTLGVAARQGGGSISESELIVEFSYYGSARGRWSARPPGDNEIIHASWGDATGDLFLNEQIFLSHVPKGIWQYELGGYPVLKKWLGYRQKDRRASRPLSLRELDYFRQMIHRIAAMLLLRPKLDENYERVSGDTWSLDELFGSPR
jgi:Type ISP C-terminal specificity domain/N-6 DNA Methylase